MTEQPKPPLENEQVVEAGEAVAEAPEQPGESMNFDFNFPDEGNFMGAEDVDLAAIEQAAAKEETEIEDAVTDLINDMGEETAAEIIDAVVEDAEAGDNAAGDAPTEGDAETDQPADEQAETPAPAERRRRGERLKNFLSGVKETFSKLGKKTKLTNLIQGIRNRLGIAGNKVRDRVQGTPEDRQAKAEQKQQQEAEKQEIIGDLLNAVRNSGVKDQITAWKNEGKSEQEMSQSLAAQLDSETNDQIFYINDADGQLTNRPAEEMEDLFDKRGGRVLAKLSLNGETLSDNIGYLVYMYQKFFQMEHSEEEAANLAEQTDVISILRNNPQDVIRAVRTELGLPNNVVDRARNWNEKRKANGEAGERSRAKRLMDWLMGRGGENITLEQAAAENDMSPEEAKNILAKMNELPFASLVAVLGPAAAGAVLRLGVGGPAAGALIAGIGNWSKINQGPGALYRDRAQNVGQAVFGASGSASEREQERYAGKGKLRRVLSWFGAMANLGQNAAIQTIMGVTRNRSKISKELSNFQLSGQTENAEGQDQGYAFNQEGVNAWVVDQIKQGNWNKVLNLGKGLAYLGSMANYGADDVYGERGSSIHRVNEAHTPDKMAELHGYLDNAVKNVGELGVLVADKSDSFKQGDAALLTRHLEAWDKQAGLDVQRGRGREKVAAILGAIALGVQVGATQAGLEKMLDMLFGADKASGGGRSEGGDGNADTRGNLESNPARPGALDRPDMGSIGERLAAEQGGYDLTTLSNEGTGNVWNALGADVNRLFGGNNEPVRQLALELFRKENPGINTNAMGRLLEFKMPNDQMLQNLNEFAQTLQPGDPLYDIARGGSGVISATDMARLEAAALGTAQ